MPMYMCVTFPMRIETGRVDPGELTQGRVDLVDELARGRLDPLPPESSTT